MILTLLSNCPTLLSNTMLLHCIDSISVAYLIPLYIHMWTAFLVDIAFVLDS